MSVKSLLMSSGQLIPLPLNVMTQHVTAKLDLQRPMQMHYDMTFCKEKTRDRMWKDFSLSTQSSPSDKCVVGEGHERRQVFDEEQDRAV